jgi:colanic acid biosynthesis glycosyl transferase WcaI
LWIGDGFQRQWSQQEACRRGLTSFVFKPYQPRDRLAESLSVPDVHLMTLRLALAGLIFPSKFYAIVAAGRRSLFI